MNICRLCLHKGDNNQVLSVWDSHIKDLPNKIWSCVSIKIEEDDDLPTTACLSCIHKVSQWTTFKQICHKTNTILLSNSSEKSSISSPNNTEKVSYIQDRTDNKVARWECDFDVRKDDDFHVHFQYKLRTPYANDYVCDICENKFDTCVEYLNHQIQHNGDLVFQCDKCPEIFDSRDKILEHDRNHKKTCPYCGKTILNSSMKLHLIKHTDRHICSHCSNRFNSKASLLQHIITVHTNIKNHVCDTCGKKFSSPTAMRVHMKSHSNERLYKCKLCIYAGRTASALYVHMSTHANDLCVCEVCSKTFKSSRNLNDHLRRVHNKIKNHECSYCGKRFVDRYVLSVHLRHHTGVRPYKCTKCEKTFIRSDGLKEHMAIHGQRISFDCEKCAKKFRSRRGIAKHIC